MSSKGSESKVSLWVLSSRWDVDWGPMVGQARWSFGSTTHLTPTFYTKLEDAILRTNPRVTTIELPQLLSQPITILSMTTNFQINLDIVHPDRILYFSQLPGRGAGPGVAAQCEKLAADPEYTRVDRNDLSYTRWRGYIGTFIAEHLGKDSQYSGHSARFTAHSYLPCARSYRESMAHR